MSSHVTIKVVRLLGYVRPSLDRCRGCYAKLAISVVTEGVRVVKETHIF